MNKKITLATCFDNPASRSALVFFLLLLSGDIAFIVLHYVNTTVFDVPLPIYNIEFDRGVSEFFQYLKYIWIIAILFLFSWAKSNWHYLALILIFAYFLLDDSFTIHEDIGWRFASRFEFEPFWGLRLQDFGELTVTLLISGLLIIPLSLVFWIGDQEYKKFSLDVFILILILAFFGVGVDMLHIMIDINSNFLGVVEDGGEMLVLSAITTYVYYKLLSKEYGDFYICDQLRRSVLSAKINLSEDFYRGLK